MEVCGSRWHTQQTYKHLLNLVSGYLEGTGLPVGLGGLRHQAWLL
jgi:hypothetical protein